MRQRPEAYTRDGTLIPRDLYEAHFFGPWRTTVTDNNDPSRLGRLRLACEAHGNQEFPDWVWPVGGGACGGAASEGGTKWGQLFLPPVGAAVYVEFTDADPQQPRWLPGWLGNDELPDMTDSRGGGILTTDYPDRWGIVDSAGNWIVGSRKAGGEFLELRTKSGLRITITDNGKTIDIESQTGTINLNGATVNVGDGANSRFVRWTEFNAWATNVLATHTHGTAIGPTFGPVQNLVPPANMASAKANVN